MIEQTDLSVDDYIYLYISDNVYVKSLLKNSFIYAEYNEGSGVKYPTDFKSVGFRSCLIESRRSSLVEEWWYNETVYDNICSLAVGCAFG